MSLLCRLNLHAWRFCHWTLDGSRKVLECKRCKRRTLRLVERRRNPGAGRI